MVEIAADTARAARFEHGKTGLRGLEEMAQEWRKEKK
jgi:hypothetical protein